MVKKYFLLLARFSLYIKTRNIKGEKTMEKIKRVKNNICETFFNFADRFPGLSALIATLVIVAEVVS